MKRYSKIIILALAVVVGLSARAFCYEAEVSDISGSKYFPAVKEAIQKAEKSINIAMFIVEVSKDKVNSKVNQLVSGLIEAKNRGLDVEVILDQNVDFVRQEYSGEAKIRSMRAYKRLKEAGIKVHYDEPIKYAHAKAIIIDKRIVILGSTNWTESSFDRSIETNVLIESEALAGEILDYLKTIKLDSGIEEYLDFIGPSTAVPLEFMTNPKMAPLMVKSRDERAFDIYLYLLKNSTQVHEYTSTQESKNSKAQVLDYGELAKYLGIYEGWERMDYIRQIIKSLRHLEKRYKLIKFEPGYGRGTKVTMVSYESIDEETFELPDSYFDFGWRGNLFLRAKFCYLINLACADASDTKPFWSKSVATIAKQFGGVGTYIINNGMGELRRKKLIDVRYDEITGKPYEKRAPKMYKVMTLYNPKELEAKLKDIEIKYGKKPYNSARTYAKIVFEENNPEVIEDIILKTKEYGRMKVRKAFNIVRMKSVDNPKKVYEYVVGIIERTD